MLILKEFLLEKIMQPHPKYVAVVPQSVPIVFFGNIEKAEIATLSLNPSNIEFENFYGYKRLTDRDDLRVDDNTPLTKDQAEAVYSSCLNYFHLNPYRKWFDPINEIFKVNDYEYYNERIVHLDISPWATSEKYSKLASFEKDLITDISIIQKVLDYGKIKKLFINGRGASEVFQRYTKILLMNEKVEIFDKEITLFKGKYKNCEIVGWSPYWQNSYLTTEQRREFINLIGKYI